MRSVRRNLGNLDVADAAASAAALVALPGNSAAAARNMLIQYAAQNVAAKGNAMTLTWMESARLPSWYIDSELFLLSSSFFKAYLGNNIRSSCWSFVKITPHVK